MNYFFCLRDDDLQIIIISVLSMSATCVIFVYYNRMDYLWSVRYTNAPSLSSLIKLNALFVGKSDNY